MIENDYNDLFNLTPAIVIVIDLNFTIIAVTDAFLEVSMAERKTVLGQHIFDAFPINRDDKNADEEKNIRASFNRVITDKQNDILAVKKYDVKKTETTDGAFEARDWKLSHSPVFDANNNVKYIIQHREDITENQQLISSNQLLKKNNELLAESYEYAEAIIGTIHETMLILDKDFYIKSASKSFYKKHGITKEETEGKHLFELENGQWNIPELQELLNDTNAKKTTIQDLEVQRTFPNLGKKTMLLNANCFVKKTTGEESIILAIKDISEVRKLAIELQTKEKIALEKQLKIEKKTLKKIEDSEKRYNLMLTTSPFAIAILKGKDMVVTLANDSIKEIWGKGNAIEGKKFISILPELKDLEFPKLLDEVYTTGIAFYGDALLAPMFRNGKLEQTYFNFVYQPYLEADETISGVTIIAYDVTAQVMAKKELIEAKINAELKTQIAEEAVKSKQQFLSNMSHEIRTPMNGIIGFTNVVLKTKLDDSQKEYISAIKESGDALIVLINDILDLAKVDSGKMTFEKLPLSLSLSIGTMLHLFEPKMKEKNLKLINEYDSNIPLNLIGDPMRLRQIILNLMSNAVKFTAAGTISIRVRLVQEDAKKATVEFVITDTGIGVPKNKLAEVFNNFEQAGVSSSFGGTGLGLAIVKQLVELQGGTIMVESEEGKGSSFGFVLPFEKRDSASETTSIPTEPLHDNPYEEKTTENIKVLVVEDIALNQLLIKIILLDFGYDVTIADNGKLGIENLEKNNYDIILMDLQMPEMNGFEATAHIRNTIKSDIPIIALTADVTSADVKKCKAVGMNDYVSKPIDEKLLYSKINQCLQEFNKNKRTEQNKRK
ncbi:ATP-binding protein [Flavobacterium sp. ZS1P14]|uniref:PAS domain-containing hybrid sensor histidine kinase/response regulator n=1 Tax=Flavobacterium sp. ZS1P14 TaxID=3401729 RepID=UPI003AAF8F06